MWKVVTDGKNELGMVATTVGELKEMLKYVPDNYTLSVTGTPFGMLMEVDDELVLMDEPPYLETLLLEQEENGKAKLEEEC